MKERTRRLLRSLIFLLLLGAAVIGVQGLFGSNSSWDYEHERNYLLEKPGSLDGVYVGTSNVHAFWQPAYGWKQHGIAVWNYSIDAAPAEAIKYMVIEARKTQPDALYIINLNTFKAESVDPDTTSIHRVVDYMPFSLNRLRLTRRLTEKLDMPPLEKLEFYLPIIRFHTRWDELKDWVYGAADFDYKGSLHYSAYQKNVTDYSKTYRVYEGLEPVSDDVAEIMDDLLDYCDAEKLRVLFVIVPQVVSREDQGRMQTLAQTVRDRGYTCLDLLTDYRELKLDLRMDFYNRKHTNVHGSLKFADWLGTYLMEQEGMTDKRGQPGWESWEAASESYLEDYLGAYHLPFELSLENRTELEGPAMKRVTVKELSATVTWDPSEGADGYEIFRKADDRGWESVTAVEASASSYTEEGLEPKTKYTYTAVPFLETESGRKYGHFSVNGVSGTTGGT
ncbi:MAG: fibronectin type III domain-containing protein [Clostridia bacterium]|nr:fibronectin type III domain-containing protein [Clostridia bacterium]